MRVVLFSRITVKANFVQIKFWTRLMRNYAHRRVNYSWRAGNDCVAVDNLSQLNAMQGVLGANRSERVSWSRLVYANNRGMPETAGIVNRPGPMFRFEACCVRDRIVSERTSPRSEACGGAIIYCGEPCFSFDQFSQEQRTQGMAGPAAELISLAGRKPVL
jgi:hypothetical protein